MANARRSRDCMRTYGHDYRLVFVGDATMSPYEILQPGGSIEHWNEEPGAAWMKRLLASYPRHAWLNPEPTGALGIHAVDPDHARAVRGPDVPADARRPRPRDALTAVGQRRDQSGCL